MTSPRLALMASLLCLGATCVSLSAQTDVTLELGASQIGPAAGVDTDDARFAIGGLRASSYASGGSGVYASFLAGQVFGDSVGGSFVSALIEATLRRQWSARWSGSLEASFLGFGVEDPFPYRTLAGPDGSVVVEIWEQQYAVTQLCSYIVEEGTRVGKNDGRVIHIGDNLVLVKETYEDFAGERTTKDVELRIRGSQGG